VPDCAYVSSPSRPPSDDSPDAEGTGNREITGTLDVTLDTVEVQLGRIYGKLDIKGRLQPPTPSGQPGREVLDRVLEALQHQDVELASIVIHDDDRLDGRYLEVHHGTLSLLALQAPVASDLRVVAALLDVIKHAERMGDQCVNIAKLLPLLGHEPPTDEQLLQRIEKMGKLARSEVYQAKQGFLLRDVGVAEALVGQDEEINALNREVFRRAVEIGTDADRREWAMAMMLVSRAIERIGDNAVDIGEQVAFVVTGLFREFSDASHPLGDSPPR
jgi:phosphate transport system protein